MILNTKNEVNIAGKLEAPALWLADENDKTKWANAPEYVLFSIRTDGNKIRCIATGKAKEFFIDRFRAGNPIEIKGFLQMKRISGYYTNIVNVREFYDNGRTGVWFKF